MDMIPTGFLLVDGNHLVRYCNRAFCQLWKLWQPTAGLKNDQITALIIAQIKDPAEYRAYLAHVFSREGPKYYDIELEDGRTIAETTLFIEQQYPRPFIGRIWMYEDISHQKGVLSKLQEVSEQDDLTGLLNRRRFRQELDRARIEAGNGRSSIALLLFDLDGFKLVNDQLGHPAGDTILTEVARRIKQIARSNELLFRIGGDEFALLMRTASKEGALQLARRISEAIGQKKFCVDRHEVEITTSIGVAIYPLNVHNPKQIVRCADQAMYQAKSRGKNQWAVYPY